ncbi:hypothetical protein CBR_g32269 [Chara braunii]|uniref:Reverse transcriptase domain-containing protein n=1 Tax=Chara braunii TaxID=69332 RepID=A0A388JNC7_CHABU|nr:hypothetical protein CBR_g32269 [Chara braunii]|eukprot:GBG59253.1 hypothetical protein CBR_g32269 [Chara braunii]
MTVFLARLGTYMQQVQEEQQHEAAAEAARLNAIACDAEQRRRQHEEAAANHNKARKDAASVLMQQEALHTAALQAWNVDPAATTEPTAEDQTKSALASMMHQVILTCNWQQVEFARRANVIASYEETLKSLHPRLDMLETDDVPHRHTTSSRIDPSIRELEGRMDHLVVLLRNLNSFQRLTTISQQIAALQADLRQLQQQPTGTCNSLTQRRRPSTTKLGKLSSAGSEATPLPTLPDTVALLATSSRSGEHAYVASLHESYEDYAVQLVPPLDQPLHVQESCACATSSPSPSEPASSPTLLGDSLVWSRLEDLDPLTPEDFQWMPLPPSGSLSKPHCNALMEELHNYLHVAVPTPVMGDGETVVDLHEYIAKIDHEYATQREDHPVNFYRRTVHVRDRNGILGPCTTPPPHPSIGCHVVSAASIRNSIARNDVEEMGICFLQALPPPDEPAAEQPLDPRILQLLDSYGDVFEAPVGIVPNRPIRHEIILEDGAVPPRECIYRMSEEGLEVLRTQLDDLIDKGWIRPSCSPYGAPVLFVRKKNKELRLCINYRKLNAQTIKNVGPLPRIDDLLQRLGGAKYFSKLDLKAGYHQLEIHPRDRYKTAFKTQYGHFEWVVMQFGLTNAPATFQAAMTIEFRDMLDRFVLIYLDDILVYSRTLDEHIVHLRAVLDRLRTVKYKANRAKCEFAQQELEYLGHFVTPQGIRPLSDKIKTIQEWLEPTNTTEVRSFMGLAGEDHPVNFYRRTVHVRDRNGILGPCTTPPPHPSIGCHVVSAASIRNSIARNDVEEMGICFLQALPPPDEPAAEQPLDPRILQLLDSYGDVFEAPVGIVPNRPIRHEIILEDGAVPPRECIYRMSEEGLEVLRTQLDDLIDKGWIRPSCSPYGAPVLFVRKKNKELRLCINYRKLNAQTIKNVGPLPRIDDLLQRLGGAKYFSKLDLKAGYHQLEIHPRDRYKTAFKTQYGHFEWVVMQFGLTNAPATFQAAMTIEFRDMLDRFVLIYLDDILVYSRTLDEHIVHLRAVLDRLRTVKYKANRAKCEFAQQELEYLGHFVTPQGIRPLSDKIKTIQEWLEPTNTTEGQGQEKPLREAVVNCADYFIALANGDAGAEPPPMLIMRLNDVPRFKIDDPAQREPALYRARNTQNVVLRTIHGWIFRSSSRLNGCARTESYITVDYTTDLA